MATTYPFRALNPRTKRWATIPAVKKISKIRLNKAEWIAAAAENRAATTKGGRQFKKSKKSKKREKQRKTPSRAIDAISHNDPQIDCGLLGNDEACNNDCYDDFVNTILTKPRIDIIGPDKLGYGVFTAAKTFIKKGDWLEEYIGEIRPMNTNSLYAFELPTACRLDSLRVGNWTRFVNSSCKPNVRARAATVGKRHVILFQAAKNIGPGEELRINYGGMYFQQAGLLCKCDANDGPHMPKGGKKVEKDDGEEDL
ncbi:hypothetical protein TI39_contig320g00008 [Zymoseptoria brevis]|uniref:SET domain-containing protein n=1 Tax=Zymoseptoria brevis TaxID=1047168 RepID=A0A0F4GTV1_9PEZI|nr:hypothetical protein TI39_contig320g00008 [Zymoseptoria brevis]